MNWHRIFFDVKQDRSKAQVSIILHISLSDEQAIITAKAMMPFAIEGEKWSVRERVPLTPKQLQELHTLYPESKQYP
jgi:hypothetical protein